MASNRRPAGSTQPPLHLPIEQLRLGRDRLEKTLEAIESFNPALVGKRDDPEVHALERRIDDTLERLFGAGTSRYQGFRRAAELDSGPRYVTVPGRPKTPVNFNQHLAEGKQRALLLMREAFRAVEEDIADAEKIVAGLTVRDGLYSDKIVVPNQKIFIVHGHDEGARETVARFLSGAGFTPIILHEQANQGRTVIEKIVEHGDVGFAVVLLTPDDTGAAKGQADRARARQNVLLELGYFIGRLGRERVCALKKGELELPSDFGGVVYEAMDAGNGWKLALGRELKAAGYDFSFDKALA
jgi:predicted nucleotide-binding protein